MICRVRSKASSSDDEVAERHDQRRVADEPRLAVDLLRELCERRHAVLRTSLGDVALVPLDDLRAQLSFPPLLEGVEVDSRVPDVECPHRRELRHRFAIGPADREVDPTTELLVELAAAAGDGEARDEPLQVPLERPGQRLVEVVRVEDEAAVRGGVGAEVGEVRVPAELRVQAGPRHPREVGGHEVRRAPVERERRDEHPAVADRNQLVDAALRLRLEELDRVEAHRRRLPLSVRTAGHVGPRGLASGCAFGEREVLDRLGRCLALVGCRVHANNPPGGPHMRHHPNRGIAREPCAARMPR